MATHTLVTKASTTLTAVTYSQSPATLLEADLATIAQAILNDTDVPAQVGLNGVLPGAFNYMGFLIIPGRGLLKCFPGDVVAVDTAANVGFPVLVSKNAIANGNWTFT